MRSPSNQLSESVRFGSAVRNRRNALGLTQAQAAALAECDRLFVSEVERGKSTVRLDKLLSLLGVLGLQLALETGSGRLEVRANGEGS